MPTETYICIRDFCMMTIFIAPKRRRFHLFPITMSIRERLQYLAEDFSVGLRGLLTALCMVLTAAGPAGETEQAMVSHEKPQLTAPFTNLPNDILLNIVDFLPPADVVALSMTNKAVGTLLKHPRIDNTNIGE